MIKKNALISFLAMAFSLGLMSFSSSVFANEATGFQSGSQFFVQKMTGDLSVNCPMNPPYNNGPFYGTARCYGSVMSPSERDYFVGPKVDSDHVTLWVQYEDGSKSKEKTEKYLPSLGRSKNSFNLGIHTLFQKPLLAFGRNIVHYSLTKKDTVVQSGDFEVNVVDGGSKTCQRDGFFYAPDSGGCSFPERYCSELLSDPRYCN